MNPKQRAELEAVLADLEKTTVKCEKLLKPIYEKLRPLLAKIDPSKLNMGVASDLLYALDHANAPANLGKPFGEILAVESKTFEDYFVEKLKVGEQSGVQGVFSRTQITESAVPTIEDWAKLTAYIVKTKSWDLLNKQVNREAAKLRWKDKKVIPGVKVFHAKKVSCTKLARAKKRDD